MSLDLSVSGRRTVMGEVRRPKLNEGGKGLRLEGVLSQKAVEGGPSRRVRKAPAGSARQACQAQRYV